MTERRIEIETSVRIEQRWWILPCKTPGTHSEPLTPAQVQDRFMQSGGASSYWKEVTLGLLQLNFVPIPEWLSPKFDLTGYPGKDNSMRRPFMDACIQEAIDRQYPVNDGHGIVVFMNTGLDLYARRGEAKCMCHVRADTNQIAHEIGHALSPKGLEHSFGASSPALLVPALSAHGMSPYSFPPNQYHAIEYGDRGDIMSVGSVWDQQGNGPRLSGPGLAALSNILQVDIDAPGKIYTIPWGQRRQRLSLSPLYDQGSVNPNLAKFSIQHGPETYEYSCELRLAEGLDSGFPNAGILVHERRPDGIIVRLCRDRGADPDQWLSSIVQHDSIGFGETRLEAEPEMVDHPGQMKAKPHALADPPLQAGQELVDPTRRLRVKIDSLSVRQRKAKIAIEIGVDPFPFENRLRAVNAWAVDEGFTGAFPNFQEANYGPGWSYSSVLLNSEAVDWRDIPATELGFPTTFEERFQAVNHWAFNHGYRGAYPNFHQADYSRGTVYGTLLLKPGFASWRDIRLPGLENLAEPATPEQRFSAVNQYAHSNGYLGAFPTFHSAQHGPVFGTILIKPEAADWRDLSAKELGNPVTLEDRIRATNHWASRHGYRGAFPTFHQADYGQGTVYGTILIKRQAAVWRDIPAQDLGDPGTPEDRFRAMHDWAIRNNYGAAFPNFQEADYGQGTVYGTILLKREAVMWRDIPASHIDNPTTAEARFRAVSDWAFNHGYRGGFPNFYSRDRQVHGAILIEPQAGQMRTLQSPDLGHPANREARFRAIHDRAKSLGFRAGFPTFEDLDHGRGTVFGTILFGDNAAEWRDIPAAELGFPGTIEDRFRAVNDWAFERGYRGGFPNANQADHGQGIVYGTILIKRAAADWRDIPASQLGNPDTPEDRFRATDDWASEHGYLSAFPNFHQAKTGRMYGTILIKPEYAEHRDIPLSELVFR